MFLFCTAAMVFIIILTWLKNGAINTKLSVAMLLGVTVVAQWQYILTVINEMCYILEIDIFITKQERIARHIPLGGLLEIVTLGGRTLQL